jgi:hypothetical protein
MADLPILGYKRHPLPTLTKAPKKSVYKNKLDSSIYSKDVMGGDEDARAAYLGEELQRIENSLDQNSQQTTTVNDGVIETKQSVVDLEVTVDANTASITQEAVVRASADSAMASLTTALTATVATNASTAAAAITAEQLVRATADTALASDITTLTATVTSGDSTNAAAITAEQTARATADTAIASDITTLTATVTSGDATNAAALVVANAAITAEQTARATADTAIATDITNLSATVTSGDATNAASVTSEATARATADTALATDITTLTSTVNGVSASVTTEASTRASADATLLTSVNSVIASAATAQATADGKIDTFYQDGAPSGVSGGDLWFDTDDGNTLYRYSGTAWVVATDSDLATAISNAATAQSTADGKVATFYQDDAPTAEGTGDLWVDTNDGNKLYRWSGSAWTVVQDTSIPALEAHYGVTLNANGYITGFSQNNDGTTGTFKVMADKFTVVDPSAAAGSAGVEVFDVSGGYATIKNIRSAATGARLQIESDVLTVYDSSSVLRVKLGNLA